MLLIGAVENKVEKKTVLGNTIQDVWEATTSFITIRGFGRLCLAMALWLSWQIILALIPSLTLISAGAVAPWT